MPSAQASVQVDPTSTHVPSQSSFTPCLRLRRETLLIDRGEGFGDDFQSVETAVAEVWFDYGGARIQANDPADSVAPIDGQRRSHLRIPRDFAGEARARRVLEGFGPLDLALLEDCALQPGARADYVIHPEGDPDVLVMFGAQAVPRLRSMGWRVDVDDDYPCHVVAEATWYASLGDNDDDRDWFELELGVEVDGRKIDLLPLVLELIETRGGLEALSRPSARRMMALPLGGNRYLPVPPQRLRDIARVVVELYHVNGTSEGKLRLPQMVPDVFDQLDLAFEGDGVRWEGDPAVKLRAQALARESDAPVASQPSELRATLRPYQLEGLAWLQRLRAHQAGGVLADDMGLGKTLQTISHLVSEKAAGRLEEPALVIAPTSLVGNWQRELEKFAPHLRVVVWHGPSRARNAARLDSADVVITTYPLVIRDRDVFAGRRYYIQILDEAQAIKNTRSQAHQSAKAIDAEYRLCITGTPVENNLEELWALFDFAMPGLLGDAGQFRTAFRYPIERDGNEERLETLRRRVAPFVLRRMKDRVAQDLPSKTEIVRPIEIRGRQRDLYESIRVAAHATVRKAVKKKGFAASQIDILGALMKLRQACCDPRLIPIPAAQRITDSAKFKTLLGMLDEMLVQGRKILIFSQFTSMLALIGNELAQLEVPFVSLTGATQNRQAAVDEFQNGAARVFLISLKAGGTGLNLTRADTVIHYDPWWNPAAQAQATDRAYRIGQKNPVFVYNLIVAGSVEERMLNLQRHKQALADGILAQRDASKVELSENEVDDLFAPLADGDQAA